LSFFEDLQFENENLIDELKLKNDIMSLTMNASFSLKNETVHSDENHTGVISSTSEPKN